MHRRLGLLVLVATSGCAGDAPDVEPLDTSLLSGDMSAAFEGAPFEPAYGLLYFTDAPGTLLLSTAPVTCPFVDPQTVPGLHVTYEVSSIEPGEQTNRYAFWQVTDTSTLDYRYADGTLDVAGATDDTFDGTLTLSGAEANLEGAFSVRRCDE